VREVTIAPTLDAFRQAARRLISEQIAPEEIVWREATAPPPPPGLFDAPPPEPEAPAAESDLMVPRPFVELARSVSSHPDPDRWRLLYSVLWKLARGDRGLLLSRGDPDLQRLRRFDAELQQGLVAPPASGAAPFVSETQDLDELARAAASCRGCDLYRHATQTVFGKGPSTARAVLVGEQPGDQEDLQGAPFVGPAGEVLDRALAEAAIPRQDVYVTNAVKHFKFIRTGRRRIHQTPGTVEIGACRPWLEAELAIIRPRVLVCLGATASRALIGPDFRITRDRGRFLETRWAPRLLATYHPSAVLRAEDQAGQDRLYGFLVGDLRLAATALGA
jgi:uracil-DNA glycosylase